MRTRFVNSVFIMLAAVTTACASASIIDEAPVATRQATLAAASVATATLSPTRATTQEPTGVPSLAVEPAALPDEPIPVDSAAPVGATADWTATDDPVGIDGIVTVNGDGTISIEGFVFLADEAPGVDIRLGFNGDYSDEASVSLRDITGKTYEGRTLTLTIPAEALSGQTFNTIGVVCYDTGDVFDSAELKLSD